MRSLYQKPVITIKGAAESTGAQINAASALIADFVRLGILRELTGQRRNREFMFDEYVNLFMRETHEEPTG